MEQLPGESKHRHYLCVPNKRSILIMIITSKYYWDVLRTYTVCNNCFCTYMIQANACENFIIASKFLSLTYYALSLYICWYCWEVHVITIQQNNSPALQCVNTVECNKIKNTLYHPYKIGKQDTGHFWLLFIPWAAIQPYLANH